MKRNRDTGRTVNVSSNEGYARWAATYDAQDNPMTAMVDHVLSRNHVDPSGARVLEIGCGTGRNASTLLARGIAGYTGIDDSSEMLDIARARHAREPRCRFERRDARTAWWSELGRFDIALVSLVLEHLETVGDLIESLRHVAAQRCLLWVLELHPQLHDSGVRAHLEIGEQTLALPSYRHTAVELEAAAGAAGWRTVASTDWSATADLVRSSPKLARYVDRPVLLEYRARFSSDPA